MDNEFTGPASVNYSAEFRIVFWATPERGGLFMQARNYFKKSGQSFLFCGYKSKKARFFIKVLVLLSFRDGEVNIPCDRRGQWRAQRCRQEMSEKKNFG